MADNSLKSALKRLFSTNVIIRKTGKDRLKVTDTSRIQTYAEDYLRDKFSRVYKTSLAHSKRHEMVGYSALREQLYRDYEVMDQDPILSSACDIYADECTTRNEHGDMLTISTTDDNIKEILENLFFDILNVEFNLWPWVRNLTKYGDFFLHLDIHQEYGIINVQPLSVHEIDRVEETDPNNPHYVKFIHRLEKNNEFENYEIAHFRLLSDSNFLPYGKCLTSNSYVKTKNGAKRINEINVGDEVWSFNTESMQYELTRVINTCESGKKDIIQINTRHNSVESSDNHPFLVYDGCGSLIYKNASELSVGDLLVLSDNTLFNGVVNKLSKNLITEHNKNGWKNNINILPDTPDTDFCRFFGFMFGDGWVSSALNSTHIALGVDEEMNNKYISLLQKYSHTDIKISNSGVNTGAQAWSNSKLLSEFLYVNGLNGDARTKKIPEWVFELPSNLKLEFIKGLVDADGSIYTDKWNCNRYQLELSNKRLIEDVKELLDSLMIKSSHVNTRGHNGRTKICGVECNCVESHYIYFYLDSEPKNQLKKYNYIESDKFILQPISSIKRMGVEDTYDIQVESSNSNFITNGVVVHNSMLENGRRVYKQLQLMEDAMLIHRIMRAPAKRIFTIDVGNIPPNEVDNYMNQVVNKMKKEPHIDKQTGEYNLRYNMQNMTEDFYLPVRGQNSNSSIDELGGLEYDGTQDIEYLQSKLMAALKIPKSYLGYEEGLNGKATLAQEDIRFARTIERIQRIVESELTKIAIVHLYAQGYTDDDLVNFSVSLNNPSTIYTREQIEILSSKMGLISDIKELGLLSNRWIYENILELPEDEIDDEIAGVLGDKKLEFRMATIENEGKDPEYESDEEEADTGDEDADDDTDAGGGDTGADDGGDEEETGPGGLPPLQDQDEDPTDKYSKSNNPKGKRVYTKKDFEKFGKTGGRPKHTSRYEKDDYIMGRDPIGRKSIRKNEGILDKLNLNKLKDEINLKDYSKLLNEENLIDDN